VLLSTKHFTPPAYQGRKRKLACKFAGLYEVVQVVSPVAVKLSLPSGTKAHPVFHTSILRPYVPDTTGERTPPPPEPVIVDGFEEYEVEQILAQRRSRNQTQYIVKWKNFPSLMHHGSRAQTWKATGHSRGFRRPVRALNLLKGEQCKSAHLHL
jgi:hypothetical protein